MGFIQTVVRWYDALVWCVVWLLQDIFLLISRIYVADIFFTSGWNKFSNLLQGKWEYTVFLFKEVHPVPHLSPEVAAILGTSAEIVFPILLAIGLFARVGALGLLGVTAVITFGVHPHFTHVFWALILGASLIFGPGKFSADYGLRSWWNTRNNKRLATTQVMS